MNGVCMLTGKRLIIYSNLCKLHKSGIQATRGLTVLHAQVLEVRTDQLDTQDKNTNSPCQRWTSFSAWEADKADKR